MSDAPLFERKLTTILSADAANYSRRMAEDEENTVRALQRSRRIIDRHIEAARGRIANTSGDGLIAEFPSVVHAVSASVRMQQELGQASGTLPFRFGLHLDDVVVNGEDLLGDGVNLAARLQEAAPEGGIFVSRPIMDHARSSREVEFTPMPEMAMKNVDDPIDVFAVTAVGLTVPRKPDDSLRAKLRTVDSTHFWAPEGKPLRRAVYMLALGAFTSIFAGPITLLVFGALALRSLFKWRNAA